MEKSVFLSSGIDRVFVDCLREIERSYIHHPKQARIRIEKWVEKLVSTGRNPVWQKHRNAYAKLLLNMVLAGNLADPFHALPPDGPLPSFPHHLKSYTKNLLGAHESVFWHELYNRVHVGDDEKGGRLPDKHDSITTTTSTTKDIDRPSKELTTLPQSREIQNLNFLIKEQNRRIQLLEEQLHTERTQHELQLQRLQYTHRIEVGTLRNELYKQSGHSSHLQSRQDSTLDLDYSRASPIKVSGSHHSRPTSQHSTAGSILSASKSHKSSSGSVHSVGGSESHYGGLASTVGASTVTLPAGHHSHTGVTSASTASVGSNSTSVFDISVSPSKVPLRSDHTVASGTSVASGGVSLHHSPSVHSQPAGNDLHYTGYNSNNEIIPTRVRSSSGSSASVVSNVEDKDFMAYISQFQNEINKINSSLQSSFRLPPHVDSPGPNDGVAGLGLQQPFSRSEFSD